jgi:hypothetical protein
LTLHDDVAAAALQDHRIGLAEPDLTEAGLDPTVAESTVAVEVPQPQGAVHI